jgi:cell wall-associated NlpC family hydrolase
MQKVLSNKRVKLALVVSTIIAIISVASASPAQAGPPLHQEPEVQRYVAPAAPSTVLREAGTTTPELEVHRDAWGASWSFQHDVLAEAMKYIGTPYVFAGSSPSGFDCSGFTMFVYGNLGVSLPHSASAQAGYGHEIPESQAIPGDLVEMPGHVGLYVSPGLMLDAPTEGESVGIHKMWTSSYYIVRVDH